MFFVALSGTFWLLMTLNETFEKEVRIPVRISDIPKNVVLTSNETDTISVVLRDKGTVLIGYAYGNRLHAININFKSHIKRDGYGVVSATELQKLISQKLPASTNVTEVKTEFIEFFYNNGKSKRVPVKWTGQVTPEQPYFISEVLYFPDSVDVFAQESKLEHIRNAYTIPINKVGFRDSLSVEINLQKDRDVKVMPERVRVKFLTDILTEESVANIPIECINLPAGKTVRTFPSKVTVNFVTGLSRYRAIRQQDFKAVIDYNEIAAQHPDKCTIYLAESPSGLSRVSLSINKVDYLIEEEELETSPTPPKEGLLDEG